MNSCCICCPLLNSAEYLDRVVTNMESIGKLFTTHKIIFFYDESPDKTMDILVKRMKTNENIRVLINSSTKRGIERTYNIAHARNKMLDHVREHFPEFEYFIMMDGDDVCSGKMRIDVLERSLQRKDWDALSFNRENYYDLWALSLKHLAFSLWHFEQPNGLRIYQDAIASAVNECKEGELIEVLSAFNGFGIYRTRKFIGSTYDGRPRLDLIPPFLLERNKEVAGKVMPYFWQNNGQDQDCEHRSFHMHAVITQNAKIRISPDTLF